MPRPPKWPSRNAPGRPETTPTTEKRRVRAPRGSACQADTVRVAFHPHPGARYSYEVNVRSVTVSRLGEAEPERSVETAVLRADHLVLSDEGGRVRVRVQLRRPGTATRTYVVRF